MIHNELPNGFPWYDRLDKQQRFKPSSGLTEAHTLIAPCNGLLPFCFRVPTCSQYMQALRIMCPETGAVLANLDNFVAHISSNVTNREGFDYYWFPEYVNGEPFTNFPDGGGYNPTYLLLQSGYYYLEAEFATFKMYSECFHVPDKRFKWDTMEGCDYTMIEWSSGVDLRPLVYSGSGISIVNRIYLMGSPELNDPEYEVEVAENGITDDIPIFQKMKMFWSMQTFVPEFVRRGVAMIPMHQRIRVSLPDKKGSAEVKGFALDSSTEPGSTICSVGIKYEELMVTTKANCGTNMGSTPCPGLPDEATMAFAVTYHPGGYTFYANIPPETSCLIKGSYTSGGGYDTIIPLDGQPLNYQQLADGIYIPWSPSDYQFFIVTLYTFIPDCPPLETIPLEMY